MNLCRVDLRVEGMILLSAVLSRSVLPGTYVAILEYSLKSSIRCSSRLHRWLGKPTHFQTKVYTQPWCIPHQKKIWIHKAINLINILHKDQLHTNHRDRKQASHCCLITAIALLFHQLHIAFLCLHLSVLDHL